MFSCDHPSASSVFMEGSRPVANRPNVGLHQTAHFGGNYSLESGFERREHSMHCQAVLSNPTNFPCVPRYYELPFFDLRDIHPKVADDSEGMFPFLLLLPEPMNGETLSQELKRRFQQGPWYLKPNTVFTPLKRSDVDRATFQVSRRGAPRKDKISVYVSKLRQRDDRYIVEFRRSGRYFQEVPSEFLPIQLRGQRSSAAVALPKFFLIPCAQEQALSTSTHGRDDLGVQDTTWIFRDSRYLVGLTDVTKDTKLSIFNGIVSAVDEASCAAPPAKRQKILRMSEKDKEEEDATCALWWDLRPLKPGYTSSIEDLFDTILHQCLMFEEWMTLQEKFQAVCDALAKQSGRRITLLVLENAQLLHQDLSACGRWMLLSQIIAEGGSATKVVCLYEPEGGSEEGDQESECVSVPATRSICSLEVPAANSSADDTDDSTTTWERYSPSSFEM